MTVLVIDSVNGKFGQHAYSQLKELGLEAEKREADFLDIPGILSRSEADSFMVISDKAEDYSNPVIEKILHVELDKGMIEKVFLDSSGKSQEIFVRHGRRKAGQAAENLAERLKEEK